MNWLKENSEEFAAATEATQDSMVREWQQMLDDMRGTIRTHWDEVESIIAQGETAIIEFLKATWQITKKLDGCKQKRMSMNGWNC